MLALWLLVVNICLLTWNERVSFCGHGTM